MGQKAVALLIVVLIGGITTFVLYSPATVRGPEPQRAAVDVPGPLQPAPPREVTPAPVRRARQSLPSSNGRVQVVAVARVPAPETSKRREAPSLVAGVPLADAAPLAEVSGRSVPAASGGADRGAMRAAGQSIGAAFATTGRSVGTAFKRVF